MDDFLNKSKLPKSIQEKMENFKSPVTIEDIRRSSDIYHREGTRSRWAHS
jgi:hypothetical protein